MPDSLAQKLSRAFKWHWNLLAFGAALAVGLLSGHADIVLPAIMAAELGYLGFIGIHPRFQNVLRGKEMLEQQETGRSIRKLREMIGFLAPADRERFDTLRERCMEFRKLRDRMRTGNDTEVLAELRTDSLDKMLWLFLKLLHHKTGLDRFLDTTDEDLLVRQAGAARQELDHARAAERNERLVHSLDEKATAIEQRLQNYRAAVESRELVNSELDKTEQRIAHISEVGMTSRVPSDLGIQIDGIAESMASSEATLGDLTTGFDFDEDDVPSLVAEESGTMIPPPVPQSQ
jgi:hypothetical protein